MNYEAMWNELKEDIKKAMDNRPNNIEGTVIEKTGLTIFSNVLECMSNIEQEQEKNKPLTPAIDFRKKYFEAEEILGLAYDLLEEYNVFDADDEDAEYFHDRYINL